MSNNRKTITWINLTARRYGGFIHGQQVRDLLAREFDVEFRTLGRVPWRFIKPLAWIIELFRTRDTKDLWIRDDLIAVALPFRGKGKQLVIVRHIDSSVFPPALRAVYAVLEKLFYRNLRGADVIVTISEYWKQHFVSRGYSNVYKINGGYSLLDYQISEEEVSSWRKKAGLTEKPIVYIGNCLKEKGVVEVYEALRELPVHLVTSGEPRVNIPAININGTHREYLCLLKAASIVITMSRFKEGWPRTAHEAMLLKTPVIGSGKGGMRELLEGGGQIICEDIATLLVHVTRLLEYEEERERLGEAGFVFAETFTTEKFEEKWLQLVRNTIL